MVAQVVGGVGGAFTYALVYVGATFPLGPVGSHSWLEVGVAEVIFTFVLTYVVLCIASPNKQPAPEFIGFAIGSCVTVGGFAIGKVSGGSLNPAVSFGISTSHAVLGGGSFYACLIYTIIELLAGAA